MVIAYIPSYGVLYDQIAKRYCNETTLTINILDYVPDNVHKNNE